MSEIKTKRGWIVKGDVFSSSYKAIHLWLGRNYGRPKECSRCKQAGKQQGRQWNIEWALKPGFQYRRERESYEALCRFCHRRQDHTPEIIQKGWETRRRNLKYGRE